MNFFVGRFARLTGKRIREIDKEALAALTGYDWPGNVRELQDVIERGVILSRGNLTVNELPESLRRESKQEEGGGRLKALEKETIIRTLAKCSGNRRLAAMELGISRRTLQYRLKEFGLVESD